MNREEATWILQMFKERDAKTDAERDAIDYAIQRMRDAEQMEHWSRPTRLPYNGGATA